jgi:hypothetical protein
MNTKLREVLRKYDVITRKKFKNHHIKAFILGIQIVQHILQTTLTKDMVSDSFPLTGQYIKQTGKCDVDIILGKCTEAFTTEEVTKIWAYLSTLCKTLKEIGKIPEKDFLPLGMSEPVDPSKRGRDDLVLNRGRFCFLTNPFLIKRQADKVLQKEAIAVEKADKVLKRKAAAEAKRLAPKPVKRARKNAPVIAADVVAPPAPDIAVAPVLKSNLEISRS